MSPVLTQTGKMMPPFTSPVNTISKIDSSGAQDKKKIHFKQIVVPQSPASNLMLGVVA